MKYKFNIFYDEKTGQGLGIEFKDGSRIVLDKKKKTLRFALPREKFDKPFEEQKKKGFPDYEFELSMIELKAMLKALNYKKGGKNHA